jgi:hypothetical protein
MEAARDKARKWHELLDQGIDPARQAEQDRLALLRSQDNTFLSVAEAYFCKTISTPLPGSMLRRSLFAAGGPVNRLGA